MKLKASKVGSDPELPHQVIINTLDFQTPPRYVFAGAVAAGEFRRSNSSRQSSTSLGRERKAPAAKPTEKRDLAKANLTGDEESAIGDYLCKLLVRSIISYRALELSFRVPAKFGDRLARPSLGSACGPQGARAFLKL